MYPSFRKHGIDSVYAFPIEKVKIDPEWNWELLDKTEKKALFQNRANILESAWIRKLRTCGLLMGIQCPIWG